MQQSSFLQLIAVLSLVFLISGTSASYQLVNTIDNYAVAVPLTEFNNQETLSSFTLTEIAPYKRSVIINGIYPIEASIDNGELNFANNIRQVYANYQTIDESPLPAFANAEQATAFALVATLANPTKITINLHCTTGTLTNILTVPSPSAGEVTYNIPYTDFPLNGGGSCQIENVLAVVIYVDPIVNGNLVSGTLSLIGTAREVDNTCLPICGSIESNSVFATSLTVIGQGLAFTLESTCGAAPYAIFSFNSESYNYVTISTSVNGGWGKYDFFLQKQGSSQCSQAVQFRHDGMSLTSAVDNDSLYYIFIGLGEESNPSAAFVLQGNVHDPPPNDFCNNAIVLGTLVQDQQITVSGTTLGASNGEGCISCVYYTFFSGDVEEIFITTCAPGSTTFDIDIQVGYENIDVYDNCPGTYEQCYAECGHYPHYGANYLCLPEQNTGAGRGVYHDAIPLQPNRRYFIQVGRHQYARSDELGSGDFTFIFGSGTLCVPDCAGKTCGDNGCGGSCGVCGDTASCSAEGICVTPEPLPVTLATAVQLNIPSNGNQLLSLSNVYDVSVYNPETPNDACFVGTSNPLWYYVQPSDMERTITVATCETTVDTVIGVFLADGTLVGCNDDRDASDAGDCSSLSSFVEFTNSANTGFYVVVAGLIPMETGDIDLVIQSHVQTDNLIEESTNLIIDSLTEQVTELSGDLSTQITGVNSNVDNARDTLVSAINGLSASVDGQFDQLTSDLSGVQTAIQNSIQTSSDSLSSQITDLSELLEGTPASLSGITNTVNTISTNVNQLSTDLSGVSDAVGAVNALVQGVSGDLGELADNLANLDGDVQQVSGALASQATAISDLQSSLTTGLNGVNGNIDSVSSQVSAGFGGVADSFTALNGVAQGIIDDVAEGNAVGNNIYDFIRSAYFESFLLSTTSSIDSIPWRWRTPAAANGSMDDVLAYLITLYNSKLAACNGVTNTACNTFRQSATPAFLTLNSSYNTQVNNNRYKKAFQVLQTFYTRLFPTSLWV